MDQSHTSCHFTRSGLISFQNRLKIALQYFDYDPVLSVLESEDE